MAVPVPTYPDLAGKVAVVTGGSRGIGAETCRCFAANGMKVAVVGRDEEAVSAVVTSIRSESGEAIGLLADCTDRDAIEDMRAAAVRELGPVDVLAAFAGFEPGQTPIDQVTVEMWRAVIEGNLTATFQTVTAFLPGMMERRRGSVITMSSAVGRLPDWSSVAYASAKAGILMFTRRLAYEVGRYNIRVNALAPSAILTERNEQRIPSELREKLIDEMFVLDRFGTPADCANAALFLASDASSWITGQTTDLNGGQVMM